MVDWSEQRRFARHPIQLPILHDAASPGSTEKRAGWTRNLSEGGACLELDEHVPVPSLLHLHLQTDHGAIEVDAQVVWEMEDRESGEGEAGVLHGVAFTHLSPEQLQALRGLLRSHGQDWRDGLRLPLDLPVTCEPEGATAGSMQGRTGDVSRGGLLLRLSHALPPGTKLKLALDRPKGRVSAEGEIVWAESVKNEASGPVRHGVRFTALGWSRSLSLALLMTESAQVSTPN